MRLSRQLNPYFLLWKLGGDDILHSILQGHGGHGTPVTGAVKADPKGFIFREFHQFNIPAVHLKHGLNFLGDTALDAV